MYAPLICLRYCELRAEMAGQRHVTPAAHMALRHEPAQTVVSQDHGNAHGGHVPLDELRTMLAAVTEYVISVLVLALMLLAWRLRRALNPQAMHPPHDILTPPPRMALA